MIKLMLVGVDDKTALALGGAASTQGESVIDRCKAEEAMVMLEQKEPDAIFLNITRNLIFRYIGNNGRRSHDYTCCRPSENRSRPFR